MPSRGSNRTRDTKGKERTGIKDTQNKFLQLKAMCGGREKDNQEKSILVKRQFV